MHHSGLSEAQPGDNVGFNVRGLHVYDIHRGNVASDAKNQPAGDVESFVAQVIIMNHPGHIAVGYTPIVDCHTSHTACQFSEFINRQDRRTGKVIEENPVTVQQGDGALVRLVPTKPLSVECFSDFPPLGRFALRDNKHTIGVGIIKEVVRKQKASGAHPDAPPASHNP